MKRDAICIVIISLVMIAGPLYGQNSAIHAEITNTYNFQPHLLGTSAINQKSAVLDQFWSEAKANPSVYVPALQQELADFGNPPFFLYDGSMLLISLSDVPESRKIALAAMARCDLRDIQAKDYFLQVHRMASLNADTTEAAFHILTQPKFRVFIPQHVLTLGQDYALIYMLLPTDQEFWLGQATKELQTETDGTAQKSLLLLLWYAQAGNADQAISAFANDTNRPLASRTYARGLLGRTDALKHAPQMGATSMSESEVRSKRRERMKAVSDEALEDLDRYTAMLMAKRQ